jgi:hypothetical protein
MKELGREREDELRPNEEGSQVERIRLALALLTRRRNEDKIFNPGNGILGLTASLNETYDSQADRSHCGWPLMIYPTRLLLAQSIALLEYH